MEVLVAVGILGVLTLAMLQMTKSQSDQSVNAKIATDISQIKVQIQSIITNPPHCNANFFGKTGAISATSVYQCSTYTAGACRTTGSPQSKIPVNSSSWTGTGSSSERVRVSSLSLSVVSVAVPSGLTSVMSTGMITATFQAKALNGRVKTEDPITFNTPVVINSAGTVLGCPKSWNSTEVY